MHLFRAARALASTILLSGLPALAQAPQGWPFAGNDLNNSRWAPAETTINAQNAGGLVLKWEFTTHDDVSATPSVDAAGGFVYFPDWAGNLYKLNASNGTVVWSHKMTDYGMSSAAMSRTTPALYGSMVIIGASPSLASSASTGSFLLGLNASDGSLVWSTPLDSNLHSISTASPIVYDGIAYVGVSSWEEKLTNPTFRGSLLAVSVTNGRGLWRTYFAPTGYSGAPVWSSTPVIDTANSQIYVTTGNNYLVPESVQNCEQAAGGKPIAILNCQATGNFEDSIVALDLTTGHVKWAKRCSVDDAFIGACIAESSACPDPAGSDLDFGAGANLIMASINGVATPIVGAGQKSGAYWALSTTGPVRWSTAVGPGGKLGGIEWGTASDNQRIYVALSNNMQKNYKLPSGAIWNGASWAALNPATGAILWQVPDPGMNPIHSELHALALGPVTVANGVVYAGSTSGYMYALDAATGATLWSYLAAGSVNAAPAIVNGTLYWGSGYHHFPAGAPIGTASNKFYAFSLPAAPPPPVVPACAVGTGQVGVVYGSPVSATGGVPPYVFSISAGMLPIGLTLSGANVAGTPSAPGDFAYTLQAMDSTGTPAGTGTTGCGISVAPAPVTLACPVATAQLGASYSSALTASGGVPPYGYSITAGALPAGLSLDGASGAIGGAPGGAGSFSFTAQVADSTGAPAGTASSNCTIAVPVDSTTTTLTVTPNPASVGQPVVLTAQIAPAPGAGKVTFYNGTAVLGSAGIVNGSATLTTGLLTANSHRLHAMFTGNASYTGSSSVATVLAVAGLPSSTFLTAVPFTASGAGTAVRVGDFNGDGKADFAVANGGISVWLGNGDGTFQGPVNTATVDNPIAMAAGDFNGDGWLDLAVVSSGGVAVMLGLGDGTFQPGVNYTAGSGPVAMAAADFNGDGTIDLGTAGVDGVNVLLGNGDGTFQTAVNYAAGSGPAAIAAGDFTGSGKASLVVANAGDGTLSMLLGNGDGTFQAAVSYPIGGNPEAVAVGDLNGDGRLDVVAASGSNVNVLPGNGDGTLQAAVSYTAGSGPAAVAVADVNGDGYADVVAGNSGDGTVAVLLGNGDGTLQSAVAFATGSNPAGLTLADFNADSRTDIVVTGGTANTAAVLFSGQATTGATLGTSLNPATVGQPVTFTATVAATAPYFGTPTGTVTFWADGTVLDQGIVALSSGQAMYTTSSLAIGTPQITGAYSGDAAFLGSTPAPLIETIVAGGN